MNNEQTTNHRGDRFAAVALSSADAEEIPVVVAKGYGAVAELIVEQARAHGLYVHASADLVKLLMNVNLDDQIPPQLYAAIAELLVWLHELEASTTLQTSN